jgi:hypothetical protein
MFGVHVTLRNIDMTKYQQFEPKFELKLSLNRN